MKVEVDVLGSLPRPFRRPHGLSGRTATPIEKTLRLKERVSAWCVTLGVWLVE